MQYKNKKKTERGIKQLYIVEKDENNQLQLAVYLLKIIIESYFIVIDTTEFVNIVM